MTLNDVLKNLNEESFHIIDDFEILVNNEQIKPYSEASINKNYTDRIFILRKISDTLAYAILDAIAEERFFSCISVSGIVLDDVLKFATDITKVISPVVHAYKSLFEFDYDADQYTVEFIIVEVSDISQFDFERARRIIHEFVMNNYPYLRKVIFIGKDLYIHKITDVLNSLIRDELSLEGKR